MRLFTASFASVALVAAFSISPAPAADAAPPAAASDAAPRSAKQDLSPQNLSALHTLIRPHEDEWRHLRVQWLTDVVAARKQAAAQDKPIVILYTGGAGYNEPLGTC